MVNFDLVCVDHDKNEIGILLCYEFDLAFGIDENDFTLTVDIDNRVLSTTEFMQINTAGIVDGYRVLSNGYYIYIDGTEFGGMIDGLKVDTANNKVIYHGVTWHGLLEQRVISPDAGQAYYIMQGEAHTVLANLITRLNLSDIFKASTKGSSLMVSGQARYQPAYTAIRQMLAAAGARLQMTYQGGHIVLSVTGVVDYSQDEEFDSSYVDFVLEKYYRATNHLICLGGGELEARTVVHLFADASGNISQTQTQFGMDLVEEIYDYPNAESTEQLIEDGTKRLSELWNSDRLEVDLEGEGYAIGDIVGAYDDVTGITITQTVNKKIVRINGDDIAVQHLVGEL